MKISYQIAVLLMIIFLSCFLQYFPDYYAYLKKPPSLWYSGQASWFDPWDINIYLSAINWGKRDGLLFENLYDTRSLEPLPIYFVYTLIGKFALFFKLSNALAFHLSSFILGLLFMLVIFWFIGIFIKDQQEKLLVFAFLFLSGGVGWLFFPQLITPDLGNPGFLLTSPLKRSHEALSFTFLVLSIGFLFKGTIFPQKKNLILGGLAAFLTILIHPHNLMILSAVFAAFSLFCFFKDKKFTAFKPLIVLTAAGLFFYLTIGERLIKNPGFAGLIGQIQASSPPLLVILGWGLLSPFILTSFFVKKSSWEFNFLKIWFISHWLLLYFPIHFQKLFIRGLYLPAVLLAIMGVKFISQKTKIDYRLLAILLLIFSSIDSFYMFSLRMQDINQDSNRWIYLTQDEGKAFDYLNQQGQEKEGVLASWQIANMIPANTNKKVYVGHTFQTPDFEKRMIEVEKFFQGKMSQEEAENFLNQAKIQWIFLGPQEKTIGKGKPLPYNPFLKVFESGETALFYKKSSYY